MDQSQKKCIRLIWTKFVVLVVCFVAIGILSGCHDNNKQALPDEWTAPEESKVSGVYIPAVELPAETDSVEYAMMGLVVYKGGIYTSAELYYGDDAGRIDELVGDYLGYATGSINEWSTQDEYAVEFASSCTGEVYSVKGYDTDFRVCIRQEYENENSEQSLQIMFLDRLNDISLTTGADLFESKLHISDNVEMVQWQSHDDWNNASGNLKTADIESALWKEFLNQVDMAEIQYTWKSAEIKGSIYDTSNQAHINLLMNDGTMNRIRLIEGGYVGYAPMAWYFVKIPGDTFDAIFAACGGKVD